MLPQELGSESEQLGGAVQMKRHGNLWAKICDYDNILAAHRSARRGKSHYKEVKMVNSNEEFYIREIQKLLTSKTFTTSPYEVFDKHDGRKMRTLYKLPYYPDRIVQHALLQVLAPIWSKSFIRDTFQSIPGRGTHDARRRVEKHIRRQPPKYALKFDIAKYYPNVNNAILKQEIGRKIKCADTLWLMDDIIDSAVGIPIGNYTSQYFGNVYLARFDWWVVQELKPYGYFRYCDDIVLLADTAEQCHALRELCFAKLANEYALRIKPNWQAFPVEARGLDFVGYVFKTDEVRLRPGIARNFKRKTKEVRRRWHAMRPHKIVNGLGSYWGWCKHVNAKKLWFDEVDASVRSNITKAKERLKNVRNRKLGTSRLSGDRPGGPGPLGLQNAHG
jgi:hypothetical protein